MTALYIIGGIVLGVIIAGVIVWRVARHAIKDIFRQIVDGMGGY